MVTCGPDGGPGRVVALSLDGLGPAAALAAQAGGAGLDDLVHVLHELELLPPQVLLLDELLAGLVLLLPQPLLLRLQPGGGASVTFTFTLKLFTLAFLRVLAEPVYGEPRHSHCIKLGCSSIRIPLGVME